MKSKLPNSKLWDYFILIARFLLAITFLQYGISKLTIGQFGIAQDELLTPIKDLSLFKVMWYLFDHQPFKGFIGFSQVVCGALLLVNRTTLIGAILFLPITVTILVMDISFMSTDMAIGFAWRLTSYLILDGLIIWHYRDKIRIAIRAITKNDRPKYTNTFWVYLLLPIFAIALEMTLAFPRIALQAITHPAELFSAIQQLNLF